MRVEFQVVETSSSVMSWWIDGTLSIGDLNVISVLCMFMLSLNHAGIPLQSKHMQLG